MSENQTLYGAFVAKIDAVLIALQDEGVLPADCSFANVSVEPPRDASHGDMATNAAMVLSKKAKSNPRALAEKITEKLAQDPQIDSAEIAGPGFINLRLASSNWRSEVAVIAALGDDYGKSSKGAGRRVNVEYVSANPTGPMHMGHCRGAVVGDALASLLEFAGHDVTREYYINDAGGQVDVLARSVFLRYQEALGRDIGAIPEGLYPGDYLKPVGEALAKDIGDKFLDADEGEWLTIFREKAVAEMMVMIRSDLAKLGIRHDVFSSEAALQAAGKPEAAEKWLREQGLVYDGELEKPKGKEIADWEAVVLPLFRSTKFGDDQDRPIKKANGKWTYFGADLAYHMQKAENADELIDVWGADHAGTVKRIKAAVAALSEGRNENGGAQIPFDVKLVQMVQLLRDGQPAKMSKRSGNFVTIADMVDEVGKDVVRFSMLTRKPEAQMDFDFAKVIEASKDNPVFYVQYAHARVHSIQRKAAEANITPSDAQLDLLGEDEWTLVKQAAQFPREVEAAAKAREPHRIAFYLYDLASTFHTYWNLGNDNAEKRIIVVQSPELSAARLFLSVQIGQVVRNGLALLGVEAVEEL